MDKNNAKQWSIAGGHKLNCPICSHDKFWHRMSLMNSRGLTALGMDWADQGSDNFICSRCGYVMWFFEPPIDSDKPVDKDPNYIQPHEREEILKVVTKTKNLYVNEVGVRKTPFEDKYLVSTPYEDLVVELGGFKPFIRKLTDDKEVNEWVHK